MASTSAFGGRAFLACLISPILAGPVALLTHGMVVEPGETLESLPLVLLVVFITPIGFYGYFFALLGALIIGLPLAIAARSVPALRRKRMWLAAGALAGAVTGLLLGKFTPLGALVGGTAGVVCALVFRLVVGSSLHARPLPD